MEIGEKSLKGLRLFHIYAKLNNRVGFLQEALLRHSGESRNPELLNKPGFRVALRPVHQAVQGCACPE